LLSEEEVKWTILLSRVLLEGNLDFQLALLLAVLVILNTKITKKEVGY